MTATDTGLPLPRTARWREAAVVAAAGVLCLLGGTIQVDDTLTAPPAAAYLVALASCAVLPVRRRAPLAALAGTTAVGVLVQPLGLLLTPPIVAPALIAAYAWVLAAPTERRAAGAVSLAAAALLLASVVPLTGDLSWKDASRMGVVGASPLVAGVVGQTVRHRRAYLAAVEERAARAEESREIEARRRVAEERVRIARELHDLVAHQITLANAQAQVAAQFFDTRPDQSRTSLRDVVATTGQALDELRATVGLLRQTGDTAEPAEPAPGLAQLPELLETFRRAGLEVAVREEGTARPLPPGVDLTAYRIVQEALTNVTKHARTDRARIALTWHRDRVTVTVADDGPGGGGAPEQPPGYGLIGMRERAMAVGGDLSAGRRPEGGFLVTARLPAPGIPGGAA
ncbi:sensor histidine kinase [Streptomyces nigra]|uniref:sensor histidine kinase n=1 Tax=Streptomyces nigra TaxID=1827580 RepID=UPI0034410D4D